MNCLVFVKEQCYNPPCIAEKIRMTACYFWEAQRRAEHVFGKIG